MSERLGSRKRGSRLTTAALISVTTASLLSLNHERAASHDPNNDTPSASEYHDQLEHELKTAYSVATVDSAKNTGKQLTEDGDRRAAVSIHIRSVINHKTADNSVTPPYIYSGEPVETATMPDGQEVPGDIAWTDSQAGTATMKINLTPFRGATPATVDYHVGLGVYGGDRSGHILDGIYKAGDVYVTGAEDKVTSVEIIAPPAGSEPSVEVFELQSGDSSRVPA